MSLASASTAMIATLKPVGFAPTCSRALCAVTNFFSDACVAVSASSAAAPPAHQVRQFRQVLTAVAEILILLGQFQLVSQ